MNTGVMLSLAVAFSLSTSMLVLGIQLGKRQLGRALAALVAKGAVQLSNGDGQSLRIEDLMSQLRVQQDQVAQTPEDRRKLLVLVGVSVFCAVATFYAFNSLTQ
jgi:hypothetical protein